MQKPEQCPRCGGPVSASVEDFYCAELCGWSAWRNACDSCGRTVPLTFSPPHSAHFCSECFERETGRAPSGPRWELAVDRTPHRVNGDRIVEDENHRKWYAAHPDAWELVTVERSYDEPDRRELRQAVLDWRSRALAAEAACARQCSKTGRITNG